MQALLSHAPGGPETLALTECPTPCPGPGQILVEVEAAGVNFPDTLIIRDLYQVKPERPFAPGGEVAGRVAALGEGVTGFAIGQRVLALTGFGGFATAVVVDAARAIPVPDGMPADHAACFVFTYGTSHHALKDRAALQPGEMLLVLGAAGGVGAAAVELGKAAGATVIAAVSSEAKAAFCAGLGADHTIVYPRDMTREAQKAFSDRIKALAGGDGVDVVYDAVGGDYAEPALRAMAWKGRYLVVGFPAGIPRLPFNLPLLKGCAVLGVFWGAHTRREPEAHAQNMEDLFGLYAAGKIRPSIHARYPLARAGEAIAALSDRTVMGKIVVTVAP